MKQGRIAFRKAGQPEVSTHMADWTEFLHKSFKSVVIEEEGIKKAVVYSTSKYRKSYPNSRVWKGCGRLRKDYDIDNLPEAAFN